MLGWSMTTALGRGICSFALSALAALSSSTGCSRVSERRLIDTEGRQFSAKCERTGECSLNQASGLQRQDGKTALTLTHTGRLVGICDVLPGHGPDTPAECRA